MPPLPLEGPGDASRGAALRVGDDRGEAGADDVVEQAAHHVGGGVRENLHQEQAAVPQGERVLQRGLEVFVQAIFAAASQGDRDAARVQALLQFRHAPAHLVVAGLVAAAHQVRGAVDLREPPRGQGGREDHRLLDVRRPVVDPGQDVAMPVDHDLRSVRPTGRLPPMRPPEKRKTGANGTGSWLQRNIAPVPDG